MSPILGLIDLGRTNPSRGSGGDRQQGGQEPVTDQIRELGLGGKQTLT
jgi:hypothetical protein